ncbi:hypothetical protein Hanom_Chr10g00924911 [Helianthus anomalus]
MFCKLQLRDFVDDVGFLIISFVLIFFAMDTPLSFGYVAAALAMSNLFQVLDFGSATVDFGTDLAICKHIEFNPETWRCMRRMVDDGRLSFSVKRRRYVTKRWLIKATMVMKSARAREVDVATAGVHFPAGSGSSWWIRAADKPVCSFVLMISSCLIKGLLIDF